MGAFEDKIRQALPRAGKAFLQLNGLDGKTSYVPVSGLEIQVSAEHARSLDSPGFRPMPGSSPESIIQQQLMHWWAGAWKALGAIDERQLMAFPLQGGARGKKRGARMKMEGARRGTPDLFLASVRRPLPFSTCDRGDAGLWIEMKTETGQVRDSQRDLHLVLARAGYAVAVCRSLEDAQRAISDYLTHAQPHA